VSGPCLALGRLVLGVLGALLVLFLAAPIVGLVASSSPGELAQGLAHPLVWPALELSLLTSGASLLVILILGTPLAWLLARARGGAARALETALQVPIVVPPAVAGVALLMAFGRRGLFGALYPEGESVTGTTAAVVMAEVFVAAPFFLQAAIAAFRRVDDELVVVARTFGAGPLRVFATVALPLALPGLAAGAAMAWARALGEFGATLMFAGNLEGVTQTMPLAIYSALETELAAARALSIVLVAVAFILLFGVRFGLSRALAREARS